MSVLKDEQTGKWKVIYRYTDYFGEKKQTTKRGFKTKSEAQAWERKEIEKRNFSLNMTFSKFVEVYEDDLKHRVKKTTWIGKETIIRSKLLPYFGDMRMNEITPKHVRHWQKQMIEYRDDNGEGYAKSYLATLHTQLSAIFNHAVKFYELRNNPAKIAGGMGDKRHSEMEFWTQEEYGKFIKCVMDKPYSFYGFEILYWCGLRLGELLALTPADFDFENNKLTINKNYQRVKGEDMITSPKTVKSIRTIVIPDFLSLEIQEFISSQYEIKPNDRLFPFTKRYFEHEIERGSFMAGVKKIRVHDLRHSHVSLLIEMGFSALAIAERMGHESVRITYHYAHLFPTKQAEMARGLDGIKEVMGSVG